MVWPFLSDKREPPISKQVNSGPAAILTGRHWLPYSGTVDPFKLSYN
jgi:hypothetical protein